MKTNTKGAKRLLRSAAMLAVLGGVSGHASAALLNADFSEGFNNWGGEVISGVSDISSGNIFAEFPDNFALEGSTATVQTGVNAGVENWSVTMFQDFMFGPLNSGEQALLSLQVMSELTSADDYMFVQLRDLNTNDVLDLSAGGMFDVSQWAGLDLTFEFGVQDGDFNLADSLSISQISFSTSEVPEPAAVSLILLGLLAGARGFRKN